ncbi:MAG: hypothetical protein JW880_03485 [Candidatus Thermoplasmatota archaeon]|nr:hypothetical protein [Candidatus Thermoplasmatota archaeon]
MRKSFIVFLVVVAVVAMILVIGVFGDLLSGSRDFSPIDDPYPAERGYFMGALVTPRTGQSFADAYDEAANYADFVPVWGKPSPFYSMASDLSGSWGDTYIYEYTRGSGMFPLIHFSFIGPGITLSTPPELEGATLSDPAWRTAYKNAVIDTVKAVRPMYLSVGNEVNRWFEKYGATAGDPNGFQHFVSLYEEIYDEVKALSDRIVVFCVFAREIISENREADLSFLSMFTASKLDLLAFTSYVHAVQGINEPADVPDDYYSRALAYMPGKKMALTELGWPSLEAFGGQQGQADHLTDVAGRLTQDQGVELHMLGWAWLNDLDADDETGLIEHDGTEKIAYGVWKALSISE